VFGRFVELHTFRGARAPRRFRLLAYRHRLNEQRRRQTFIFGPPAQRNRRGAAVTLPRGISRPISRAEKRIGGPPLRLLDLLPCRQKPSGDAAGSNLD
jgi:hypothetical protein